MKTTGEFNQHASVSAVTPHDHLFRTHRTTAGEDITDPFYGSPQDFDTTLALIERSITALFAHLCQVHRL